ncbi:hypothetical protein [Helicobacter aurati]|nr:hypothetical protein [Helicobacter aurati]
MKVSSLIYKNTGFKLFVHVLKETPIMTKVTDKNRLLSYQDKFKLRRDYENNFLSGIQGNYAVLFLFYDDHHITLKSNVDFLDTSYLLNEYAYPYLPAVSTSSNEYREGVNTGVSNVYLAIAHEIASHYKMDLNIPQPMQKPSGGVRSIIYIMLFSLISLFLLVYFGFLSKHKE